ncbi:MAG TPA: hypothetical protein PKE30_02455 [Niabella sp.]|nr:hypothetical protein [Niabella sp.]
MLVESFNSAWQYIGRRYNSGVICSERHLQAELFHALYCDPVFMKKYNLRIEPVLYEGDKDNGKCSGLIPDLLVIGRERKIVAHVEVKYIPHGFVPYKKDVASMFYLWNLKASGGTKFYLDTNPENGDWNYDRPYVVGEDFKMIYCMIGNEESDCFVSNHTIWEGYNGMSGKSTDIIQFAGKISKKAAVFEQLHFEGCVKK